MGIPISFDRLPELVGLAWAAEMLLTGDLSVNAFLEKRTLLYKCR
ncbi:MAG: hypothetical protein ACPGZU_13140 [Ketobacter sp.]